MTAPPNPFEEGEGFYAALRRWWADPRNQPASRACLGPLCNGRRRFDSEHAGHRLCNRCKRYSNALYGAFPAAEGLS